MPEIEGRVRFTNVKMTDFLHFAAGHHFVLRSILRQSNDIRERESDQSTLKKIFLVDRIFV